MDGQLLRDVVEVELEELDDQVEQQDDMLALALALCLDELDAGAVLLWSVFAVACATALPLHRPTNQGPTPVPPTAIPSVGASAGTAHS